MENFQINGGQRDTTTQRDGRLETGFLTGGKRRHEGHYEMNRETWDVDGDQGKASFQSKFIRESIELWSYKRTASLENTHYALEVKAQGMSNLPSGGLEKKKKTTEIK